MVGAEAEHAATSDGSGVVQVGVQNVYSFASGVMFTYEPPFVYSVYPTIGPTWGEVPVTITGATRALPYFLPVSYRVCSLHFLCLSDAVHISRSVCQPGCVSPSC